jgi:allophanate hydrolase subunit 2
VVLILEAQVSTQIAITGADVPIKINDSTVENWCTHNIQAGDKIAFGYATGGCRAYLAVAGGIQAPLIFNSLSTVVRESLGGLTKLGMPLEKGDVLACSSNSHSTAALSFPRSITMSLILIQLKFVWLLATNTSSLASSK